MSDTEGRDKGSFGGRVRRYARVGTTVGGFAARYAGGRFLGRSLNKGDHAAELRAALGGLKGPLMKVAQILATIPDLLPSEYAQEFIQLQTNAPPMGPNFVRRRMKTELGADWREKFASFELEAAAAASLGQVHKAAAHDGAALACKLQYPDMRSAVDADLAQLKIIINLLRRYEGTIDGAKVFEELAERLREELDYGREACNMKLFELMLAETDSVHVPMVRRELSTDRLLSMGWV